MNATTRTLALHEAAHRRVALAFGASGARSEIVGREGKTRGAHVEPLFQRVCVTVAGRIGTTLVLGADAAPLDLSKDDDKIERLVTRIVLAGKSALLTKRGLAEPTSSTVEAWCKRAERIVDLAGQHAACILEADRAALEEDAARLERKGSTA